MNNNIITLKDVLKKRELNIEHSLFPHELENLKDNFELQHIDYISISLKCIPIGQNKGIAISGTLTGSVTHNCVVTFAPVQQTIKENISLHYTQDGRDTIMDNYTDAMQSNISHNYELEILKNEQVDINDLIYEYLSLCLYTHPRVANAKFSGFTLGHLSEDEQKHINKNLSRISQGEQPVSDNPFASLASLKEKI